MIKVRRLTGNNYEVTVRGTSETIHHVQLKPEDYQRFAAGIVSPEELIEASFRFLLERESNTSILSNFELPVISQYFPEYEREIPRWAGVSS